MPQKFTPAETARLSCYVYLETKSPQRPLPGFPMTSYGTRASAPSHSRVVSIPPVVDIDDVDAMVFLVDAVTNPILTASRAKVARE